MATSIFQSTNIHVIQPLCCSTGETLDKIARKLKIRNLGKIYSEKKNEKEKNIKYCIYS